MYDMYPYMYMHAMNTPKGGSHRYRKGLGREQKVDLAARDGHAGAAVVAACPPCSTCTLSALERSVIECCRCVDRHGRQFKVQTRRRDCVQARDHVDRLRSEPRWSRRALLDHRAVFRSRNDSECPAVIPLPGYAHLFLLFRQTFTYSSIPPSRSSSLFFRTAYTCSATSETKNWS